METLNWKETAPFKFNNKPIMLGEWPWASGVGGAFYKLWNFRGFKSCKFVFESAVIKICISSKNLMYIIIKVGSFCTI
jgi:hypothetical protein